MMKRFFSVFLACALLFAVSGCGRTKTPSDTLADFENAFNRYDMDGMLECVEPTLGNALRSLLDSEAGSRSLGYSLVFSLIKLGFPVLPLLTHGAVSNDDLPKLTLECGEESVDGGAASVPVEGTLSIAENDLSFRVTVNLTRGEDDKWYISGLKRAAGEEDAPEEPVPEEFLPLV